MVATPLTAKDLWSVLQNVTDPEIPVISVVDLGIVRDVRVGPDQRVEVDITPTYSGCPAMKEMQDAIVEALTRAGVRDVTVKQVFSPAWTTDWMSHDARERLRAYGIAPPMTTRRDRGDDLVQLRRASDAVACPFCQSDRTEERSHFGSTSCKALYVCLDCRQPFEHFKAI